VTPVQGSVPTLTEVIEVSEVTAGSGDGATPLPLAPESIPLETLAPDVSAADADQTLLQAVIEQLQPQLEALIQARLAGVVAEILKAELDAAGRSLAHELRAQLPALVREALDEVRRQAAAR
jgi:hypothetical protein